MTTAQRVFISYSSHDAQAAVRLEQALSAAGYRAWRDQARLVGETDWSSAVAQALAQADCVCLIWSDAASHSQWVSHEWLTARALERVVVPCLLPGAPPLPEPLSNTQGVVLANVPDDCSRVVTHLQHLASWTPSYDFSVRPSRFSVPFEHNPAFTGRSADLVELYLKMIGTLNRIGINQVGAVGMGGIGKTQLAVEFVYRFGFAFDGVYWIHAGDPERWLTQFVELARDRLGLTIPDLASPNTNLQWLEALRGYCEIHRRVLVVLDNVDEPELLNSERLFFGIGFTPLTLGCNLLFTTRRRFALPGVQQQSVDVLPAASAYALLTASKKPKAPDEEQQAANICNALGYLPLAIVLAAGYLRKRSAIEFAAYAEALRQNRLDTVDLNRLSEAELATRHRTAVTATLGEQWLRLEDEAARGVFRLVGLFPVGTTVPNARVAVCAGLGDGLSPLDRPVDEALILLCDLNLLTALEHGTAVKMHPLLREFALGLGSAGDVERLQRKAAKNVGAVYADHVRLDQEYVNRGADQIIEDLRIGEAWAGGPAPWVGDISLMCQLLDRERHHLRAHAGAGHIGTSLLQQLHVRAMRSGATTLAGELLEAARRREQQPLAMRAITRLDDDTLIRRLGVDSHQPQVVSVSADGARALSTSRSDAILWSVETGQPIRSFPNPEEDIESSSLSRDGSWAFIASGGTVTQWDVKDSHPFRTLSGHASTVTAIKVTDDMGRAFFGFEDGQIEIWDLADGQPIRTLDGHPGGITSIDVTADGRFAAVGSGNEVVVWELTTHEVVAALRGHASLVNAVGISDDGTRVISASYDSTLIVWDVQGSAMVRTLEGHSRETTRLESMASINSVDLSADGRLAISGAHDRNVIVWDVELGVPIRVCRGHSNRVTSVVLTGDERMALSGSWDGTILVWNLLAPASQLAGRARTPRINSVSISEDGRLAFAGADDGSLTLWNAETGVSQQEWRPSNDMVRAVALSGDGRLGISGSPGGIVGLWDLTAGTGRAHRAHRRAVTCVSISGNGHRAMSGSTDQTLCLWDMHSGACIDVFEADGWGLSVRVNATGTRAFSSHSDGTLRVWDLVALHLEYAIQAHSEMAMTVALSQDGKRALSGSDDTTIIVWDLESKRAVRTLGRYPHKVQSVALTDDGWRVIAGYDDGTLVVWDIKTGRSVGSCVLDGITSLAAAADRVAVSGPDGTVSFFRLPT